MKRRSAKEGQLDVSGILAEMAGDVEKKFGKGSIATLDNSTEFAEVNTFISTGHWALDRILSGKRHGGVPVTRLIEIFSEFSGGKTLILTHLIASVQKMGGVAVLDDTEHAYLKHFGELIGVNNDQLIYTQSETAEEFFDKMCTLVPKLSEKFAGKPILYGLDSVAFLSSEAEKASTLSDSGGFHTEKAIAIGRGVRKAVGLIGKSNIAFVATNQTRKRLDVMFGDPETTTGGDAIPFWSSIRLRLAKRALIREGGGKSGKILGIQGHAKVNKNKIAVPFQECDFDIIFDKGLVYHSGAVDIMVQENLIEQTGAWYKLPEVDEKFNGKKSVEEWLEAHPDYLRDL